ncbi:FAD-binding oxidoreductase [Agrobacterium leguminum]|uniref:FAD-binding oxidoreductase n=1 Tax=Agrobacterium leguminum TaxID=2792015 RepID=UPI0022B821D4|nr:FAD-binding oxidoreductase [Agrobacterium leguminum]MCZ7934023.1 FAD-binding oxidoreductase [Agrobacterium leguminum]
MSRFAPTFGVSSWGGVLRARHMLSRPTWRDELPALMDEALKQDIPLLACGLRRSYGDSGLNPNGGLIDMTSLDRVVHFDPETGLLRAEAGLSIDTILRIIVHQGYFIPVTPGTRFVTIAGAIANDVHGKNHHRTGTIGRWVRRIGLLRSDGEEIELAADDTTGLFAATVGGLGLTGLITWAELEVIPIQSAIIDAENIPFGNIKEFFHLAEESEADFEYNVSWIDCLSGGDKLGRGIFTRGNHAKLGSRLLDNGNTALTMPVSLPAVAMNSYSIRAFNAAYFHRGSKKSGKSRTGIYPFFYPLDSIGRWNRMYGRRGMYQYQSVVPPSVQEDATNEMLKTIAASGQGSFLAVLKTFGSIQSPGLLSFPCEGTTLALDFPNRGETTLKLMDRLDAIVMEAKGRLYPAKDGRMPARIFQAGYPDWYLFSKHIDPVFRSGFWTRVTQD